MPLSQLIDIVNERFGTDFNQADQLFFDQIVAAAMADEGLRHAAAVNPDDKFELVFKSLLENLFVERMDQNEPRPGQVLEPEARAPERLALGVSRLNGKEDDIWRFLELGVSKTAIAKLMGGPPSSNAASLLTPPAGTAGLFLRHIRQQRPPRPPYCPCSVVLPVYCPVSLEGCSPAPSPPLPSAAGTAGDRYDLKERYNLYYLLQPPFGG